MSAATAVSATDDLARAAAEYWEGTMEAEPQWATSLGDRRFDGRLEDITPAGVAKEIARLREAQARATAIPDAGLAAPDRLTRLMLLNQIEGRLSQFESGMHEWTVDPMGGPPVSLLNIESFQPVRTPAEGKAMAERWRAMGPYLDAHIANLRTGLAAGKTSVRSNVERVIQICRELLAKPGSAWPLVKPAREAHPNWTPLQQTEFEAEVLGAVSDFVRPAVERYLALLADEILPKARGPERPGIMHLPGGPGCYEKMIYVHTSLRKSPDEIHEIGQAEVARIMEEMERLGEKYFGVKGRAAVFERLRTDPAMHFTSREEIVEKAENALARAKEAIPRWFGRLPQAPCEVVRMEAHEEKDSTLAYYREPAPDGSRPGRYFVNTYAPETRTRYEAEALGFHESIPGHHLQIAISQELEQLPAFRKYSGVTSFIEGWGLYTERLADEMGLYSGDLDRIGMLSFEAWRACRLVLDTGLHAKGWTREQAIRFMTDHTGLAENNVVNEVDRYITWPGQALAYKLGQLEILRLRADAKRRLGPAFDIRAFHDAVLENGAVALEPLAAAVEAYVAKASAAR